MPRVDDYLNARKIAVEDLSRQDFYELMVNSRFAKIHAETLQIPFLNRTYHVDYPSFSFTDPVNADLDIPVQEQVVILHYLEGCGNSYDGRKLIAYREIPGASLYFSVFVKRAVDPLKNVFGNNIDAFRASAQKLGGTPVENGDAGFEFELFPKVPVQLIIWKGDDEFPPDAGILFDISISEILSPEDVAWLAGMLVYRLIALAS